MFTGNKRGAWLMPFNWRKRRDKELNEVKMIYKELQKREDIINQYYLKNSIMKGEAKVQELYDYLEEQKRKENTTVDVYFKEKEEEEVKMSEDRKLPRFRKEFKQTIIEKPSYTSYKYNRKQMDKLFGREEVVVEEDKQEDDLGKIMQDILHSQTNKKYTGFTKDLEKELSKKIKSKRNVKITLTKAPSKATETPFHNDKYLKTYAGKYLFYMCIFLHSEWYSIKTIGKNRHKIFQK
jgi:hypothetical protein